MSLATPDIKTSTPIPHITEVTTSDLSHLTKAVKESFQIALQGQREMNLGVYAVDGFCGRKFRLFLNTLISSIEDPRYLEIGMFKGATFCAAISGNTVRAFGIDDWSWQKDESLGSLFFGNLAKHHSPQTRVSILEQDFRSVDFSSIGKFNVLFYDASHAEMDQYAGLMAPFQALDNEVVIVVDDWNWEQVRNGTMRAINDCGLRIGFSLELRTSFDNEIPSVAFGTSDWHNGTFVAVASKQHAGKLC